MSLLFLSHFQAAPLLKAMQAGVSVVMTSTDLNLSAIEVALTAYSVTFPSGERLTREQIETIAAADNTCFSLQDGELHKIQVFSEATGRYYSLMPTTGAPTMLISGIPMHRIKGTDPHRDTLTKIRAAGPTGRVLDTTTGLGYTAIEASKTAESVITVELDPAALDIARQNPWSQALFDNPRITQFIGDSFDRIQEFEDGAFSRVIHDPPTFSLAGDLYSAEFYAQVYRVLTRSGRLFHYIGDLDSPSGSRVAKGAVRRLQEVGFPRVVRRPEAFGLLAFKQG